ncbi:MAG: hypothetical protein ABIM98_07300 [candidate division WOR-3 bacterium]
MAERVEIIRRGTKYYIRPKKGGAGIPKITPTPEENLLQPISPAIRPITANPEILFHTVSLKEITNGTNDFPRVYNFFTTYPDPNTLNGNYGEPYIKRHMIIQAIKLDFLPSHLTSQTASSGTVWDYTSVFNAFSQAMIKLVISRTTVFEFSCQDIMPQIDTDSELVNASGNVFIHTHRILPAKFTPFKDLLGVESHRVSKDDEVYVAIEFPGGLSITDTNTTPVVINTLKVKISLLARPQRKPYVG